MSSRSPSIAVIGRCIVAGCCRSAEQHVSYDIDGARITGPVCGPCMRATDAALFLLAMA